MTTINISLPEQLKKEADLLIENGHYVSFSDLARTALRNLILERKLEAIVEATKADKSKGKVPELTSKKSIRTFVQSLSER